MNKTNTISKLSKIQVWQEAPVHKDRHTLENRYWRCKNERSKVVIVIDDDPTGIQTVHDVNVYMRWSPEIMEDIFSHQDLAYIQTNARGFSAEQAGRMNKEIVRLACNASALVNRDFSIISRSDSSLRGHYPLEPNAIKEELNRSGYRVDALFMIPFFEEGGRFTYYDRHYIQQGEEFVPAHLTEFAQDSNFHYSTSDLRQYIEEKTGGKVNVVEVTSISLDDLRNETVENLADRLSLLQDFAPVVVNALSYDDLRILVTALHQAEKQGKHFLYRTAASFVKCYGFVEDRSLLQSHDIAEAGTLTDSPPLIVVGSHTQLTSSQLHYLLREHDRLVPVEVSVARLIDKPSIRDTEIEKRTKEVEMALKEGSAPVLFTSREVITGKNANNEESFHISQHVSSGLSEIVKLLSVRPGAVISKGGITSSDIALHGMGVTQHRVIGQVSAGVSLVICGHESKWPGMPYVIFPGNVGTSHTLREVYSVLNKIQHT